MENMTRDSLKALGVTDESLIDNILKMRGNEITAMRRELDEANKKAKDVDSLNAKIKELEIKNMTAEELQAQKIKDAEVSQKKYEKLSNKIEAKNILLNAGMTAGETLDEILDRISTEDLETTKNSANVIVKLFNATKESTELAVKADLLKNNPKPDATNAPDDGVVTKEKFNSMTYEEMAAFAAKDPEGFSKM